MKTFISTTYETSPFLAGKKIKSQAKWHLFGRSYFFSISSPGCLWFAQSEEILTLAMCFCRFLQSKILEKGTGNRQEICNLYILCSQNVQGFFHLLHVFEYFVLIDQIKCLSQSGSSNFCPAWLIIQIFSPYDLTPT